MVKTMLTFPGYQIICHIPSTNSLAIRMATIPRLWTAALVGATINAVKKVKETPLDHMALSLKE